MKVSTKNERQQGTMPTQIEELSSSWPAPEQTWLRAFIDAIRRDYADVVQRAMLFGSKARGDWQQSSDIDILVIIRDDERERWEEIESLSDELPGADDSLPTVLTQTESDWRELGILRAGFYHAVEREGVSIL